MVPKINKLIGYTFYKYVDNKSSYLILGNNITMKTYELFEEMALKHPNEILAPFISIISIEEANKIINKNVPWDIADEMINECNIFQKLKKEYLIVREID